MSNSKEFMWDWKIRSFYLTVHCGSLRQTAQIVSMSQECLRTGDKALVHFRFIKHPEYIKPNQRLVFREGRTKAVGNVVRPIPHTIPTQPSHSRSKPLKMQQRFSQQVTCFRKCHFIAWSYCVFCYLSLWWQMKFLCCFPLFSCVFHPFLYKQKKKHFAGRFTRKRRQTRESAAEAFET